MELTLENELRKEFSESQMNLFIDNNDENRDIYNQLTDQLKKVCPYVLFFGTFLDAYGDSGATLLEPNYFYDFMAGYFGKDSDHYNISPLDIRNKTSDEIIFDLYEDQDPDVHTYHTLSKDEIEHLKKKASPVEANIISASTMLSKDFAEMISDKNYKWQS